MKRDVVTNNRISQLPVEISGKIGAEVPNGISMPFLTHTVVRQAK